MDDEGGYLAKTVLVTIPSVILAMFGMMGQRAVRKFYEESALTVSARDWVLWPGLLWLFLGYLGLMVGLSAAFPRERLLLFYITLCSVFLMGSVFVALLVLLFFRAVW